MGRKEVCPPNIRLEMKKLRAEIGRGAPLDGFRVVETLERMQGAPKLPEGIDPKAL